MLHRLRIAEIIERIERLQLDAFPILPFAGFHEGAEKRGAMPGEQHIFKSRASQIPPFSREPHRNKDPLGKELT